MLKSDAVTVISTGVFYDPTPTDATNKDEIALFTYDSINVPSGVNIYAIQTTNSHPVALLSKSTIVINGVVSVSGGDASGSNGGAAGPGGGGGGGGGGGNKTVFGAGGGGLAPGADGNTVPQGGAGGSVVASGGGLSGGVYTDGGGGAFGGNGGNGNPSPGIGGTAYAMAMGNPRFTGLTAGYGNDVVGLAILNSTRFFVNISGDEHDNPPSPLEGNNDKLALAGVIDPASTLIKFEHQLVLSADAAAEIPSEEAGAEYLTEPVGDAGPVLDNSIFLPLVNR